MNYADWRGQLAGANDPAFIPIEWIDACLIEGTAQFWATDKAAMVTQVCDWPGGARTLRVLAAAGKKADLLGPLQAAATEYGRGQGCTHLMVEGREGWRRMFPDYRTYQVVLVKDLANGQ